ncbi:MAG: Crp/Fnr family transcriptional regulator [Ruminococcaceae bacterium]|nr:Crp/Fnr family transcriptional regulator [Oscillospiraceae bacterium]
MEEKFLKLLENVPLFEGVSREEIERVLKCFGAVFKEYEKNQIIFMEGGPADRIGVVLSGSVIVLKEDYYGTRNIIEKSGRGELFGEAYAGAGLARMPVSILATERSEVLLIKCDHILSPCRNLCTFHNRMIRNLLSVVAQSNIKLSRKIDYVSKRTTKEKLMAYLLDEAKRAGSSYFTIPYDRQMLADYLCVERSAMSAELSKLRDEGKIETDKSNFRIVDKR